MWRWIGEPSDYDKLVDENDANVLFPVGPHIRVNTTNAKLIEAAPETLAHLKKLATTVKTVSDSGAFKGVFMMSQIHGVPYTGPQFGKELTKALAFLALLEDND